MTATEPLPDLIDQLRTSKPSDRITLRDSILAYGVPSIQPLVDLALDKPDLTATVASWLGTFAEQQPSMKPAVVEALKELTDGPDSHIVRGVLQRLGATPKPVAKSGRPPVRSTAEAEVHARIIKAAREGRTVFYSDLETSRGHIGKYLFNISHLEADEGHPPLTSIVISKTTGRPGDGFLPAMLEVGYASPGEPVELVWKRAVNAVHAFWRDRS